MMPTTGVLWRWSVADEAKERGYAFDVSKIAMRRGRVSIPVTDGQLAYAHCLRGRSGGVSLLAINTDRGSAATIEIPMNAERYTLSEAKLDDGHVQLNGKELKLTGDDLPRLTGVAQKQGAVRLPPASITFLAIADANNPSCK